MTSRQAPRRRRWWFNYPAAPTSRPAYWARYILAEPRDAAYALPRRIACRLGRHNTTCAGLRGAHKPRR